MEREHERKTTWTRRQQAKRRGAGFNIYYSWSGVCPACVLRDEAIAAYLGGDNDISGLNFTQRTNEGATQYLFSASIGHSVDRARLPWDRASDDITAFWHITSSSFLSWLEQQSYLAAPKHDLHPRIMGALIRANSQFHGKIRRVGPCTRRQQFSVLS